MFDAPDESYHWLNNVCGIGKHKLRWNMPTDMRRLVRLPPSGFMLAALVTLRSLISGLHGSSKYQDTKIPKPTSYSLFETGCRENTTYLG